ncbi:MAG: tripartite tricarboxylate transporter permease, partial [Rhodospirillales bacterium]|nr:tripartite tricarboxylate transporter permease [Rhodospirillales bacterium]
MESDPILMAMKAIAIVGDPMRLVFLASGVLMGLVLGIIPGLGGLVGLSILLPFTFALDPFTALAMLLGLSSVTVTSDTIPAVLFSVPGTVGSAATILDGFPMAQKGEAGRALGAAFTASVLGGLFGAALLGVSIPVLRPLVLLIGSPELLAICIFGLSLVAALSGGAPLKGMAAACIGIMIATIGEDPQTATMRWTFDTTYLWDGLPIVPFAMGLFALPEIADLVIARRGISGNSDVGNRWAQMQGVRDVLKNWWLVIRCASIGSVLGAIPGMGAAVIDWIAYGHAARTEKGASETFGTGDIRGVIASEGANNAKEGGALVPTIAFGVPGSASMAILLGAFLIHGLRPGPDLLTKNLDVTYAIIWSVALANILGAGICFAFSNQFAKIALVRQPVIMPLIITVIMVGAFQGSRNWGDLIVVLLFGLLGWIMKRLGWPRPPVILGFVLGGIVERYLFISFNRYGWEWLDDPIVITLFAMAVWGFAVPLYREMKNSGGFGSLLRGYTPEARINLNTIFYGAIFILLGGMVAHADAWELGARLVPTVVGLFALGAVVLSFINHTFRRVPTESKTAKSQHMDTSASSDHLDRATIAARGGKFLFWLVAFLGLVGLVGMLPATFFFIILYMWFEGREPWGLSLGLAVSMTLASFVLFDQILSLPWPR